MATNPHPETFAERYEREVLPRLYQHLDHVFPEFGWVRDADGWTATNDAFTLAAYRVPARRLVCRGLAPRGFLITGRGPIPWTTYFNGNRPARGREFVHACLALRARGRCGEP